ncbi:MAG TPA: M1 family aminopeptidase [Ignavibacteria bacterium]|nr:M1 family aminopeptidase [Ignavibacteria bacterium]HMQ97651.1 M1 family aminopeptidase [Ignavibacteria bacterium]
MFLTILKSEIKYWLKNPAYYFYLIIFFLLGAAAMAGAAGAFGEDSSSVKTANSPMGIFSFVMLFGKLMLFLLPVIVGVSVYRDHKSGVYRLLYSFPITKSGYLSAKFLSSFAGVNIIALFFLCGLMLGAALPVVPAGRILPVEISAYAEIYFIFLLPNLLLSGIIVFTVVVLSENIYAGFISVVLLFLLRESASRITVSAETGGLGLLIEPFGEAAVHYFTRNNTIVQNDIISLPLTGTIVLNRVLWLTVSIFLAAFLYRVFSFEGGFFRRLSGRTNNSIEQSSAAGEKIKIYFPEVKSVWGIPDKLKTAWYLSNAEIKYIIKSRSFLIVVIAGIILISTILMQANPQTGTKLLPVTWSILGLPVFFFSMLITVLTFMYAGVLINRAKICRIDSLIDTSPAGDGILLLSKFLALVKMQIILLLVIMASGIGFQIYSGYYRFELIQYIFALFVLHLSGFVIWAFASLFVQNLFRNSYIGLFLLVLAAIGISNLPHAGIEKMIFRFNQNPEPDFFMKLSDLSGYGYSLLPFFVYKAYWFIFGIIIFLLSILFSKRGLTETFTERLTNAALKFRGKIAYVILFLCGGFTAYGYFINAAATGNEEMMFKTGNQESLKSEFTTRYSALKEIKQPRITAVNAKIELYPESNSMYAEGFYTLINRTLYPIDTLLVRTGFDEITAVSFEDEIESLIDDSLFNFYVFKLRKPIAPGDSIKMSFNIKNRQNTLLVKNSNILNNGTYLKSDIFPRIGYIFDGSTIFNHYQGSDADLISLELLTGTSEGQTVIAPGKTIKRWNENNRTYTLNKTDEKVKFVFGIHSGIYEVYKDYHLGSFIEVYYHKPHTNNLKQIVDGIKQSMSYNSDNFGAYPFRVIKVAEFPRSEGSYATTAANIVSISEIRFLTDIRTPVDNNIDISFYVSAHELSHQWWGNQVMPADVPGAHMITESLTEYITARIYEKRYGKQSAERFLSVQMERYLKGRTSETGEEPPLYTVDAERSYISYGKGAVAFYLLSEYIGEERFNRAVKKFFEKYKFGGPPYPVPVDLLGFLENETPDSLKYLISDMFKNVVFYDNRVSETRISSLGGGKYRIDAEFLISKYRETGFKGRSYNDDSGKSTEYTLFSGDVLRSMPLRDYIGLGYIDKDGKLIYLKNYRTDGIYNSVSFVVDSEPVKFIIDPNNLLIETEKNDNM